MSIENDLQQFIAAEVLAGVSPSSVGIDESLVRSGRVDSMGLLQILGFIQQQYGVDLASTAGASAFESISSMAAAVRRATGED